jgi:hypothetical protein
MTDFDLDRLGGVWRQQPDAVELEQLQRSAAAVSRRARRSQVVDIGAALAVATVVVLLVLSNPKPGTFLIGGAAILLLLGSNIRLRRLREVELRSLTGGTEDMLDQSIERVEKTLKHNRFTLTAIGPALLVGGLVAVSAGVRRGGSVLPALNDVPLLRIAWLGLAIAGLATVVIVSLLAMRRGRRELEKLLAMREAYRHERESPAPGPAPNSQ